MELLTPTQCTLINAKPFVIEDTKSINFPMSPLTSAYSYLDGGIKRIKIKTVLFIDALAEKPELDFKTSEDKNFLKISSNYNFKEEIPTSFNCYYVELDYTSEQVDSIDTVISYLVDLDPRTSRGTYTSVYTI